MPAHSRDLREADEVFPLSGTVLDSDMSHHGVQRVAMDAHDEDDVPSVLEALERDLRLTVWRHVPEHL